MDDIKSWMSKLDDKCVGSLDNYLSTRIDTQHIKPNELKSTHNRVEEGTANVERNHSNPRDVSISEMLLKECGVILAGMYAPKFTPYQIAAVRRDVVNGAAPTNGVTRSLAIASRLKDMINTGSNLTFKPNEATRKALTKVEAATLHRMLERTGHTLAHTDVHRHSVFNDGILLLRDPPMEEVITRLETLTNRKEPTAESLRQVGERQSQLSSSESLV